jgi:hypothetical protein
MHGSRRYLHARGRSSSASPQRTRQSHQWRAVRRRASSRRRGQVLVIVGFALVALLGLTGVAVDLGFGFAHRRQVANAAEAAAIVGAQAVSRHIVWTQANAKGQLGLLGLPNTDPYATSAAIWQEMTSTAAASVKPFSDLGSNQGATPSWPAGASNSLQGWYIVPGTTEPNGVQGAVIGSGAPPANAVGVRVEARLQYDTYFARILGACCEHVPVFASARAVLKPIVGNGPGETGPFIMCGFAGGQATPTTGPTPTGTPQPTATPNMGAWMVTGPTATPPGTPGTPTPAKGVQILTTPTPTGSPIIDSKWFGYTFRVHDEQLDNNNASCGAGDSYKGLESPGDSCEPPGVVPCTLDGQTGDRAGPARSLTNGVQGCTTNYDDCATLLPIAWNYDGARRCSNTVCPFEVITYGCFYIEDLGANSHNATLLPACSWSGETGGTVIDPNTPGAFDFKLVPDCDVPTATTCIQR